VTDTDCCELIVTAPDVEWLAGLTAELLEQRLVASGHLSEVRSIYRWNGVQARTEGRVALRTRTSLVDAIATYVTARHPYEVPGIYALPIVASTPEYLAWIVESTTPVR
jgi:periplasmic divalent cation tolerance protein